jgi:hypothetical protein|tara:strand:+ start:598 stop:729 length:132 start_codon:yes stop_codon:yes gene_type:complete
MVTVNGIPVKVLKQHMDLVSISELLVEIKFLRNELKKGDETNE